METAPRAYGAIAALAVGAVLLSAAALGLFTGDWTIVRFAAPTGLVGLAAVLLGVRALETEVGVGG